jgi:hypothetical protein
VRGGARAACPAPSGAGLLSTPRGGALNRVGKISARSSSCRCTRLDPSSIRYLSTVGKEDPEAVDTLTLGQRTHRGGEGTPAQVGEREGLEKRLGQ